jgi:hypothetical protein
LNEYNIKCTDEEGKEIKGVTVNVWEDESIIIIDLDYCAIECIISLEL